MYVASCRRRWLLHPARDPGREVDGDQRRMNFLLSLLRRERIRRSRVNFQGGPIGAVHTASHDYDVLRSGTTQSLTHLTAAAAGMFCHLLCASKMLTRREKKEE